MGSQEVTIHDRPDALASVEQQKFMPVLTMGLALQRRDMIVQATAQLMKDGVDFGTIPGTPRPTLLQPGADKLCNLFGLVVQYELVEVVKDWTGAQHAGEPFFYYEVKGWAMRGDALLGEGVGSCNSWEAKYRWRKSERTCPACGKQTIIKGKAEYGGGWLCFAKRGGCGAKFPAGDHSIESQEVGRVPNPEVFDLVNTVLKIAFKRCKVSTTINATSASEFFTQDLEDMEGIATGGHPIGTKAAGQAVAGRKIAEMSGPTSEPPSPAPFAATDDDLPLELGGTGPIPPAPALPKARGNGKPWVGGQAKMIEAFAKLKAAINAAGGADEDYYETLRVYGVGHSNEFKDHTAAMNCYRELEAKLRMYQHGGVAV